jgi:E3 ubiquitin-protein ligase MYCBP2
MKKYTTYEKIIYDKLKLDHPDREPNIDDGKKTIRVYECKDCSVLFFGGYANCEGDMVDTEHPPLCDACSCIGKLECSKHGKDHAIFKCCYCCNPAVWFCFGTTHFCEEHHQQQVGTKINGHKCKGGRDCPIGMKHPDNTLVKGDAVTRFAIGCAVCLPDSVKERLKFKFPDRF